MIPTYNPLDFENLDLRKYHIKSLKDVQRFIEFTMSRLDEAEHVIKKVANENSTLKSIAHQMTRQQEKINLMYGNPNNNDAIVAATQGTSAEAKVETVEDVAAEKQKAELLEEVRQAAANETLAPQRDDEDINDRVSAEIDKYKLVIGVNNAGKERLYWYRDKANAKGAFYKQMCKETDIPEEIRHQLREAVGRA